MSGAQILEFGSDLSTDNLSLPDLETRFERQLNLAKSIPDLDRLIRSLRPLLKKDLYGPDEQLRLRRLRQRLYDRRRHPKFQKTQTLKPISKPTLSQEKSMPNTIVKIPIVVPEPRTESFCQGAIRAFANINGEKFVTTVPKLVMWFCSASLVSYFLWQQSLPLYESIGFKNSAWASAGGILMIIGFAAYHSITRSVLALLLCMYASGYEAYLMISGTITDERQIQIQTVQMNPDLDILKEKASRSLGHYQELKARYENPESKVFRNEWYLKTHLNPAWKESLADNNELLAKKAALSADIGSNHVTWLKILYRLGLVFLCMMLVHRFFAVWKS